MDKRLPPEEVVARLESGMTLGIGGWGARRKPMALVRALLASPLKDFTVVSYGGPDVGMLCAAGKVRKLIYGFVSLDLIPLEAHFRAARQAAAVEVMEIDEGMLQWGLRAAAMRLPFLPTRVGLASDVLALHPQLKTVQSPYEDGETLLAMPALYLDAALLHVNRADSWGNSQILAPDPFFDEWFARAARCCYLSCEQLVPRESFDDLAGARLMPVERSLVHGVVEAPWGAHPTACAPHYGMDLPHLKEYAAAAQEGGWGAYRDKYLAAGEAAYLKAVGGGDHVAALPLPVF